MRIIVWLDRFHRPREVHNAALWRVSDKYEVPGGGMEWALESWRCAWFATVLPDTPLMQGMPEHVREALGDYLPLSKRLTQLDDLARLAEIMIINGYLSGESVRLDGAISMEPR